jgi:hypothetical protein
MRLDNVVVAVTCEVDATKKLQRSRLANQNREDLRHHHFSTQDISVNYEAYDEMIFRLAVNLNLSASR